METTSLTADLIPYSSQYHHSFKNLNEEWLDAYGLKEDHDLMVLDDPQATIIDRGGAIFLAMINGVVVGTAAIINEGHGVFELAKMTVSPAYRGRGISKQLIEKCIDQARSLGAVKPILFSNHQLTTAIALYEKYGFHHVEVTDSPFETADVRMERIL